MFVEKVRIDSKYQLLTKTLIVKLWLQDNVGVQKHNTGPYVLADGTPFEIVAKQLHKQWWKFSPTEYIDDISQIVGEGWTMYITSETDFYRDDGKSRAHGLYVCLDDEMMLLQCKLACL